MKTENNRIAERTQHIAPFYVMALLQRAKILEMQGRDIIHMEIGEPDFLTPPSIIQAAINHTKSGHIKYTTANGLPILREKIALFYQERYGVNIPIERIFITPGASGALLLALSATLNPNETVLMADPCYPCNSHFVSLLNAHTKRIAVNANTHYQLTSQLIKTHWQENTKGVLIASPSNPTGTLISQSHLTDAIHCVHKLNGCFYSDEIYHGLIYDGKAHTALETSHDVFVINSFSKYFGMTGWRIGWLIVPNDFIEITEKLAQNIFIATSTQSQYAALAAFNIETLEEFENRRIELKKRRDFLYQSLIHLGFDIPIKPEGAFYIYANCKHFTDDSYTFAMNLLESEGVAITPGKDFGYSFPEQYVRFAYTTSIERMSEAMQRLERFLKFSSP